MKKIVMTMVALLSMTVAVAQQSDNQQRREFKKPTPEQTTEFMAKALSLTDAQKKKVAALNKQYEDVIGGPSMRHGGPRGPRPDGETGATTQNQQQDKKTGKQQGKKADKKAGKEKSDRPQRPELTDEQKAEMKQKMEKRGEYQKKLKEVLTDEQYAKYQQMQRRGRGGHGGRGGRGQGGHRPNGPRPETSMTD